MDDSHKNSFFFIKNEKYFLDIILKYQTPNGISYKGITIYKKNLEINFLNEENLQSSLNIKENNSKNFINSLANIGLISISNIICFLYLTKKDTILLNDTGENIFYKIKNLQYIIMQDKENTNDNNEFNKDFDNFKKFFINENLFFSVCKYGNNILNHHFENSNILSYNEKYFLLFKEFNATEFITPLKKGIYKHLLIQEALNGGNDNQNNNEQNINNEIIIDIIINQRVNKNKKELIDIKDILNEKENIQEIKIDIFSNKINRKINYIFYTYNGELYFNYNHLYSLFLENKEQMEGLFLIALDSGNNKDKNISNQINAKITNKFKIEITNNNKKNNIKKFISENDEKIKDVITKDKLLIISSSNENSIFNLIQEIIHSMINMYFSEYIENTSENPKYKPFLDKIYLNIDNYFNYLDEIFCKRTMILYKLKFPKVYFITKEYIKSNINITNIDNMQKNFFSIFILTYNVAGMSIDNINSKNFTELLFPEKSKKYFEKQKSKNKYPLFYIIGLEEVVNLNAKNILIGGEKNKYNLWEQKITSELQSKINYVLLSKSNLVGILFFIFVQASEISKIKNIKNTKSKTGFYGQLGNKGSCFVEFEYENKTYGFNNGHLAAGEKIKNNNERKINLVEILEHKSNKNTNEFYMNDFYFILGDLNFRVNNNIKIIHNWLFNLRNIEPTPLQNEKEIDKDLNKNILKKEGDDDNNNVENKFYQIDENIFMKHFGNDYWKFDQLNIFKEDLMKYDIKELNIMFPPTYKYIKNSNNYNLLKREPAWTDRILFKENNLIRAILYDRLEINYSDHKPVFSIFEINY